MTKVTCETFPICPAQFSNVLVAFDLVSFFFFFFFFFFVENFSIKTTLQSNKVTVTITMDRMICTKFPICSAVVFVLVFPFIVPCMCVFHL